jgi:hypothetical protein
MTDIVEELRAATLAAAKKEASVGHEDDLRWRAASEIEQLRTGGDIWRPISTAPKDTVPVLLYCPRLKGHVATEVVVGAWRFDANRRTFGYWVSDVGVLDPGFSETGPWIEYHELHPTFWAPLPACPTEES